METEWSRRHGTYSYYTARSSSTCILSFYGHHLQSQTNKSIFVGHEPPESFDIYLIGTYTFMGRRFVFVLLLFKLCRTTCCEFGVSICNGRHALELISRFPCFITIALFCNNCDNRSVRWTVHKGSRKNIISNWPYVRIVKSQRIGWHYTL